MVDGEFLSRLIESSFEESIRRADEMVENHAELFGGGDGVMLQSWTFPHHVIVVNSEGEFFKASLAVNEDTGEPTFGEIATVDVPVREARELAKEARESADEAVDAILSGDQERASSAIGALHMLVQNGVSLTAEGVEDSVSALQLDESEWFTAVRDNEKEFRTFVGAEGNRSVLQPRYENIVKMGGDDSQIRRHVRSSLRTLKESLVGLCNSMALAREIGEGHILTAAVTEDNPSLSTLDFMDFVEAFDDDLCRARGVVEDALVVSEDGDIESLARIYDGVARWMYEMNLAAVFCEKLARRFDAPAA